MAQRPHHNPQIVLWIALACNAGMFLVELIYSELAHSAALLADSADMFGDALVYALTLWVMTHSPRRRGFAALVKALTQAGFAIVLLVFLYQRATDPMTPQAATIGWVAAAALAVNVACAGLLLCHRDSDLNMRSVWLCSRNDALANVAMILAAWLVAWTGSRWPDLVLGIAVAALFLNTSVQLLPDAWREWRGHGERALAGQGEAAEAAPLRLHG